MASQLTAVSNLFTSAIYPSYYTNVYSTNNTISASNGNLQYFRPMGVCTIRLENAVSTTSVAVLNLQLVCFTNSITFITNNLIFGTNRVPGAGVSAFLTSLYTNENAVSTVIFERRLYTTNWWVGGLQ
jgi:hypothetical protein